MAVPASAVPGPDGNPPESGAGLVVNHATFFEADSSKARLELYYQFYNFILQFEITEGAYVAEYELVIRVRDDDGRLAGSYERSREVTVQQQSRTSSRRDFRANQVDFYLDPGKYKVAFLLRDSKSARSFNREFEVKVDKFDNRNPWLSDIEFIMAAGPKKETPSAFDKGDLVLVPSITQEFGVSGDDRLLYYLEIYRGRDEVEKVRVETTIRRKWGSMVYRDSLWVPLDNAVERQFREVSLADVSPGEYELDVIIRGKRDKKFDQRRERFMIEWTLEGMLRNDYKSMIDLMRLIVSSKELKTLEEAATYEARVAALDSFWLRNDPTPSTVENEVKREFYRRVRYADGRFGFMRQAGWRSDRGRIYIKHGEPDQIDDYPVSASRRPYQEWHYYRGGRYLRFQFVDENDDGDYRLVYPFDGFNYPPDF